MTTMTVLPSPSHYPAYVRAAMSVPSLSDERERALITAWKQHQSQDAARELVLAHLKLVVKAVKQHEGYGLSQADLAQEGTVGLMKAVHKFDQEHHVKLATYAWYWIEAEIKEFILKNWRMVSWGTSTLAKKIFFGYRKTLQALQGYGVERAPPSDTALADALSISLDDARMARAYFLGADTALVWDDPDHEDEERELPDLGTATPLDVLEEEDQERGRALMRQALLALPDRTQHIVRDRFLLEPPKTLQALSQEHGVSVERVRQLEQQGLKALKKQLTPLLLGYDPSS